MGSSISWIGFKGASKSDVLSRVGLLEAGIEDRANKQPFSLAELPTGWIILLSNDVEYASPARLARLSTGLAVLGCQVEEHVMFSSARSYLDGEEAWSITHDGQRGLYDLEVVGAPPAEFAAVRNRLTTEQDRDGGEAAEVDHIFEAPIEMAMLVCGYRHDQWTFEWGEPRFMALRNEGRRSRSPFLNALMAGLRWVTGRSAP